jgi:hypothetical protein
MKDATKDLFAALYYVKKNIKKTGVLTALKSNKT